jgi:hypothetical protein
MKAAINLNQCHHVPAKIQSECSEYNPGNSAWFQAYAAESTDAKL